MQKISLAKTIAYSLLGLGLACSAAAQDARLLNLSANSFILRDSSLQFTTCTIVTGFISIVVFAEARPETPDLDPQLVVYRLQNGAVIGANDDFISQSLQTQDLIAQSVGRAPTRPTDAAVLLTKNNGNTDSICVDASEAVRGDGGIVNVQIQQVPFVSVQGGAAARASASAVDGADWHRSP